MAAQPLALTDAQITTVMQLSRPLLPDQRTTFGELLAAKLNGRPEIGDGTLYQLCRELQRELFDPPLDGRASWDISQERPTASKLASAPPIAQDIDKRFKPAVPGR
jgi:hypothetical protein